MPLDEYPACGRRDVEGEPEVKQPCLQRLFARAGQLEEVATRYANDGECNRDETATVLAPIALVFRLVRRDSNPPSSLNLLYRARAPRTLPKGR